jgi:hypothetical protein
LLPTSPVGASRAALSPAQAEAHRLLIERLQLEVKTAEADVEGTKISSGNSWCPSMRSDCRSAPLELRRQLILAQDSLSGTDAASAGVMATPNPDMSPAARAQLRNCSRAR